MANENITNEVGSLPVGAGTRAKIDAFLNSDDQAPEHIEEHPELAEVVTEEIPEVEMKQPEEPKESIQAKNFRELRDKTARLERERDEALRRARELETKQSTNHKEDNDDFGIADDELVEGKHLAKIARENRQIKKEFEEFKRNSSQLSDETRLRMKYPDIDKVLTEENLSLLEQLEPAVANMVRNSSGSLFERGEGAYKMLEKYGIAKKKTYDAEREMIKTNTVKPRPLASMSAQKGDNPLAMANEFANGMTPELKERLLAEMQEACSRY